MTYTNTVVESEAGQRLDLWCVSHMPDYSRSSIQQAIKDEQVTVNGDVVKPKYVVQVGDEISATISAQAVGQDEDMEFPEIPIIFEDDDLVVINKPAGIAAHPGAAVRGPTISQWFAERYHVTNVGESERPGVVHRLDKDTSGAMILARTPKAYERLKEQFKRHRVRKEYLALVYGIPGARDGRIVQALGRSPRNPARRTVIESGKPAITEWKIERTLGNDYTLIRAYPLTGRTHQIRVHLHFIGHPIVGDHLYTFKKKRPPRGVGRQLLHAEKLLIQLMDGKKKTFEAPLPKDFASVVGELST